MSSDATSDPTRSRVLVVDDEEGILRTFRRILEPTYEVVTIACPLDALEVMRGVDRFDAVLCDVRMPRMTGPALHAAIEATRPHLAERFVFVTATPPDDPSIRGAPVLWKPVKRLDLLDAVERICAAPRAAVSRPTPVRASG